VISVVTCITQQQRISFAAATLTQQKNHISQTLPHPTITDKPLAVVSGSTCGIRGRTRHTAAIDRRCRRVGTRDSGHGVPTATRPRTSLGQTDGRQRETRCMVDALVMNANDEASYFPPL